MNIFCLNLCFGDFFAFLVHFLGHGFASIFVSNGYNTRVSMVFTDSADNSDELYSTGFSLSLFILHFLAPLLELDFLSKQPKIALAPRFG